jgi:hypothetical protein
VRGPLLAALLYLLLTLLLTWPLAQHWTDHVVGRDVDEGIFLWNLWWVRFSLLDRHQSPFFTDFIFFPVGVSLVYYTLTLVNGLLALPWQPILGLIGTANLLFVLNVAGNGFAAFLLCRSLLEAAGVPRPSWAAFLGGAAFAFAASRWVYASFGSANLITLWPLPLLLLALVRLLNGRLSSAAGHGAPSVGDAKRTAWGQAALVVLWFALAFYTELTLAAFALFLALPFVVVRLGSAFRQRQPLLLLPLLGPLAAVGSGCLAVAAPLLFLMWQEDHREGSYLVDRWGYADGFSADLLSFFLPTRLHPLFGELAAPWTSQFTDVPIVYLGYGVLLFTFLGRWRFPHPTRIWGWLALAFAVLCLGPVLHILGRSRWNFDGVETNIPLPYIVFHYLPLISANRFPNRFSIPLTLCLAVLVAFGVAALLRAFPRRATPLVASLALVVLLFDQIAVPLPLNEVRAPDLYAIIAAEPGDFSIVQLPLGWRNSYGVLGKERTTVQAYQAVHQKRMLGGNISRNPPFKFTYFADLPLFGTLARLEQGVLPDAATEAADRAAAPALIALYDLRFLVVHRRYDVAAAEEYARRVLPLDLVRDDGRDALYRVRPVPPPTALSLAFGDPASRPYRGDGWSGEEVYLGEAVRWSLRSRARIFLPRFASEAVLNLRAAPLSYPGRPDTTLRLLLNDELLGEFPLREGLADYQVVVPAANWRTGANALDVVVDRLARPAEVLPPERSIGTTGARAPVDLRVQSAGLLSGNVARIVVNGQQVARDRRGYNLVALDPTSGRVLLSAAFDTFADPTAATRLAETIRQLPAGTIVALAAKDDAATLLTEEAVAALRTAGMTTDLRGAFRASHAAIGVVGAPPGSALEASGPEAVQLAIGRSPDERTLGLAVARVELRQR